MMEKKTSASEEIIAYRIEERLFCSTCETEIPGIFDRLSIIPHFAMPYNAQSKPVERFFRTFNDWFERELPSEDWFTLS
jgi:hypothetical protein